MFKLYYLPFLLVLLLSFIFSFYTKGNIASALGSATGNVIFSSIIAMAIFKIKSETTRECYFRIIFYVSAIIFLISVVSFLGKSL